MAAIDEAALSAELALLLAKQRTGGSVYMDGSHNPRMQEVRAAERFVRDHVTSAIAAALDGLPESQQATSAMIAGERIMLARVRQALLGEDTSGVQVPSPEYDAVLAVGRALLGEVPTEEEG